MAYRIIINEKNNIKNVLVYENDILVEQYQEDELRQRAEGNIYLGKVKDVLKGMQVAFVDIGEEKNALIHLKDIMPKESNVTGNNAIDALEYEIKDYIKQGENILVQVKRDSYNEKGARVTKDIKLVGKYVIIMPLSKFITFSAKIDDDIEKKRLNGEINKITRELGVNYGIIMRTSSINIKHDELKKDMENLITTWDDICQNSKKAKAPQLLYSTNGIVGKLINDFGPYGVEIITNTDHIKEQIENNYYSIKVTVNKEIKNEFTAPGKVWLKCGGYIKIDVTEALIAIDVNSGKCTGKIKQEETVYKVNKEAAEEIARQLRLQDLGGIIIIDFINMHNEQNRLNIMSILKQALKHDRSKVQIIEFTKLGLLELTRKNIYRK